MKNSQKFFNQKRQEVEIWHEKVNGNVDYWKKINGVSESITENQYRGIIQNNELKDTTV